jgi:hypothetical protein
VPESVPATCNDCGAVSDRPAARPPGRPRARTGFVRTWVYQDLVYQDLVYQDLVYQDLVYHDLGAWMLARERRAIRSARGIR